jgi:hypothetical protein
MDLAAAQRAVWSALLWHLRILAGWESPVRPNPLRTLAGGYEIANVVGRLVELSGGPSTVPYELGSLSTAWDVVRKAGRAEEIRMVLARSEWGDPGGTEPGRVLLGLRLAWARRVCDEVPAAAPWARSAVSALWSQMRSADVHPEPSWRRDIRAVLGSRQAEPAGTPATEWSDPARWWSEVERHSEQLLGGAGRPEPGSAVGVAGLLREIRQVVIHALARAGADPDGELEAAVGALA